ncbi:hypothetical protein [Ancylobacter defluvii]|uniref:Uncharacterized protein n=1 Tax=Ancylobacter defluvii TaxID=1282440 RepID=A0A9W6JV83_9HYPH|nr:hypothetical protein [Ancylobacter defluvii]MBS7585996.1 hypothetical protein [Ancylobacter defluvii]GLK84376.1 hypothetical protein GCM10017653_24460 [Ancylobacter defluvii]
MGDTSKLYSKIETEAAGWKGSIREFRTELRAREKEARTISTDTMIAKGSDDVLERAIHAMVSSR